ncbi:MAG TPA: protein translocase subunit SecF [Candidatus Paceibacterota bacterium]|nr:protein translocase subunit SecF [Candidatus Paceibacterota bacterium]HRZ34714.1 protein translocase subunit SecF [Candidatus Paceibacterota bacterium]
MFVIRHRKIFYCLSLILVVSSIVAVSLWGIDFGIDFTGGSLLEINLPNSSLDKTVIEQAISSLNLGKDFLVQETGDTGFILKSKTLSTNEKDAVVSVIRERAGEVEEIKFNSIGPTLGRELRSKALLAIIVVILSIMIYVAIAFSGVSKPVSSWKYGLITVIAFVHDVSVPIGLFSFLGRFYGVEVDTLFVIAILVVLGYSVNDTIVVFDRIRENLKNIPENQRNSRFDDIVGEGLSQTFGRSINTSLTTLLALFALVILGSEATKWFSLALIAGITVGTYSSIFFAAPMLVTMHKWQNRNLKR